MSQASLPHSLKKQGIASLHALGQHRKESSCVQKQLSPGKDSSPACLWGPSVVSTLSSDLACLTHSHSFPFPLPLVWCANCILYGCLECVRRSMASECTCEQRWRWSQELV